jgi:hypothetical protein
MLYIFQFAAFESYTHREYPYLYRSIFACIITDLECINGEVTTSRSTVTHGC